METLHAITAWLEARPNIAVALIAISTGVGGGMAYKRAVVGLLGVITGVQRMTERCAKTHAIVVQTIAIGLAWMVTQLLWQGELAWLFGLIVGLCCPVIYDVLHALISWRWPALAKRLAFPKLPS